MAHEKFVLRSHDADTEAWWLTEDRRYYRNAKQLLEELLVVIKEVNEGWPVKLEQTLKGKDYPDLLKLCQKRDLLSDSVFIFSAMAIEGFLNYYGVLRLGAETYNQLFERFALDKKVKALLLVCDAVKINKNHNVIKIVNQVSSRRNGLVHPKTKEFDKPVPIVARLGSNFPQSAQDAVRDMETFFTEFLKLVPSAKHLVPN